MDKNISTKEIKRTYNCYLELSMDIMGGKWKPIILYYIGINEVIRSCDLKKCISNMSDRIITSNLRELERNQLVHREVYKEIPPRVEYWLTDLGKTIMPILNNLNEWGKTYNNTISDFKE